MAQYTEGFLASARHRYETTDQPMRELARELGIGITTLATLAEKHGWAKRSQRKRGLPPAMQLLAEVKALAASGPHPSRLGDERLAPQDDGTRAAMPQAKEELDPRFRGDDRRETVATPDPAELLIKLEQILAQLITAQQLAPANGIQSPQGARNLTLLIQAMRALQGMSGHAAPDKGSIENDDDDMPRDLDAFRDALAQRIDALFASEIDAENLGRIPDARTLVGLNDDFGTLTHRHQRPPLVGNNGKPWTTWLSLGGRGAGKTRLGAEWVRAIVHRHAPYAEQSCGHIALVGESERDVREVMIEGPAGILRTAPRAERPHWISSRARLEWPNGAVAQAFSADDPDSLRGPQFDAAWCDELAKWRYADAAFDMLQFGLRLGTRPRQLITTTPRPIALLKRLVADPRTAVTRAGSIANAAFLAPGFLDEIVARYAGTRLGRQEIDGEIIEDRLDALWSRATIEAARVDAAPDLVRIVVGIDPPASSREGADACGLVVAGRAEDGRVYILEDATMAGLTPAAWATRAIALYRRWQADTLVAEANQGGEMVGAVLRHVDDAVPVKTVHATRGKHVRAEPVAALYVQGKVKHAGAPMPELEDQMCDFGIDGLSGGGSPDRLDALVWAVTELTAKVRGEPRVRVL